MAESDPAPAVVLASASPRRLDLLRAGGFTVTVDPADVDETPLPDEPAAGHVLRLAHDKASTVASRHPTELVVAADTVIGLDGQIVGKPVDAADAVATLRRLSGRSHEVLTGIAVARGARVFTALARATVTFRELADADIDAYVLTGEPLDKAGSYAIQGGGGAFVDTVEGDHDTIIGLSIRTVRSLIDQVLSAGS